MSKGEHSAIKTNITRGYRKLQGNYSSSFFLGDHTERELGVFDLHQNTHTFRLQLHVRIQAFDLSHIIVEVVLSRTEHINLELIDLSD
ncbi:hypothetical protein A2U01_0034783 [Trifolium medium]|uniref:Uncharacterized protein n=1 Tax=Trifolium medium TaxID=97028 RepID=A0A392PPB5_9FABA|nr:hypothetical protein [Trifolium medium]